MIHIAFGWDVEIWANVGKEFPLTLAESDAGCVKLQTFGCTMHPSPGIQNG